ncbi:MAG TPA: GNAT family N-acetyltransferase [Ktedonobacteraceae bacterium]|nr:GNAT family N-acetyltransferase [Ktedonobacteraceae bacterium]
MVIADSELTLNGVVKISVVRCMDDVVQVTVHDQKPLLTFRMVPDSPTGIRLEQFQPEEADPQLSAWAVMALQEILPQTEWQYAVALYPSSWRKSFEELGFRHLSERVRWEMALGPEQIRPRPLPEGVQIKPLTASAERLGELLYSAEGEPAIPLPRYTAFCQTMLTGAYGPLLASGSHEISVQGEVCGACLFTNYYGEALLAHIFLERAMQGRGLASALLRHSLSSLAQAGHPKAIASMDTTNHASRLLHTRVGFTEIKPVLTCSMVKKANWRKEGLS